MTHLQSKGSLGKGAHHVLARLPTQVAALARLVLAQLSGHLRDSMMQTNSHRRCIARSVHDASFRPAAHLVKLAPFSQHLLRLQDFALFFAQNMPNFNVHCSFESRGCSCARGYELVVNDRNRTL